MTSPSRYLHTALQLGFLSKPELAAMIKESGGDVSTAAPMVLARLLNEGRITKEQDELVRATLGVSADGSGGALPPAPGGSGSSPATPPVSPPAHRHMTPAGPAAPPVHRHATPAGPAASPPQRVVTPVTPPALRDPAAAKRVGALATRLNPGAPSGPPVAAPSFAGPGPSGAAPADRPPLPVASAGSPPPVAEPAGAQTHDGPIHSDVDVFGHRSRDDFPPGTGFTEHGMFRADVPTADRVVSPIRAPSVDARTSPPHAEPVIAEPASAMQRAASLGVDDVFTRSVVDAGGAIAANRAERTVEESTAAARAAVRKLQADGDSPNRDFSAYQLGAVIDADEFVELREAFHAPLRRRIAVKTLLVGDDPLERARFSDEAKTLGHLDHPNILPLHDIGVDMHARPFHVIKIAPNTRLNDAIAAAVESKRGKGPAAPPTVSRVGRNTSIRRRSSSIRPAADTAARTRTGTRSITAARTRPIELSGTRAGRIGNRDRLLTALCDVCDAVDHAHANGILHGDLKTESVLLGDHGEVLVTDWSYTLPLDHPVDHIEEDLDPTAWEAELGGAPQRTPGKPTESPEPGADASVDADPEKGSGKQTTDTMRASDVLRESKRPTVRARRGDSVNRDTSGIAPKQSLSEPPRVRTRKMPHASPAATGELGGAPGYMAPEVARGDIGMIDTRADVYALGAMLYEILAGERPFARRDEEKTLELVAAGARVPRVRRGRAPWPVPQELEAIARRAMSPNPEDRQHSVAAFRAEIDAWWSARPTRSMSYTPMLLLPRLVRQHRIAAGVLGLAATGCLIAIAVSVLGEVDRNIARVQAEAKARLTAPNTDNDDAAGAGSAAGDREARRERARALVTDAQARVAQLPDIDALEHAAQADAVGALDDSTHRDRDKALARALAVASLLDRAAALDRASITDEARDARVTAGDAIVRLALLAGDVGLAAQAAAALDAAPFERARDAARLRERIDGLATRQRAARDARLVQIVAAVERVRAPAIIAGAPELDAYAREVAAWNDSTTLVTLMSRLKPIADRTVQAGHSAVFDDVDRAVVAFCARTLCEARSIDGVAMLTTLLPALSDLRLQTELAVVLASTRWPSATLPLAALAVRVGVRSPVWLPVAAAFASMPTPTDLQSATDPDRRLDAARIAYARGDFSDALTLSAAAATRDASDREASMVQARALLALAKPDDARQPMVTVTNANPRDARALAVLAETYVMSMDSAAAERAFTRALALTPDDPHITLQRANLFASIGRLADALTDYSAMLEKDAVYVPALLERAKVHGLGGAYAQAIVDLTTVIELVPHMARAYADRAYAHRYIGELHDARRDVERAVALAPDERAYRTERASVLLALGELDAAEDAYAALMESDDRDKLALRGRALVRLARGDTETALALLREAIAVDGAFVAAWHDQGRALALQTKHTDAVAAYTRALNILTVNRMAELPPNAVIWRDRGISQLAIGAVEPAIADLSAAITADPELGDAYYHRARARRANSEGAAGEADATEAIDHGYREAAVYALRAVFREARGDRDEAIKDLTRAVKLDPTDATTRQRRGTLLAINGQVVSARAEFSEVLRLDPDNVGALTNRSRTALLMGDYNDAVVDAERATQLSEQWQPWATLGEAYAAMDEREKAVQAFEAAAQRATSDEERETVERFRKAALGD